MNNQALEDEEIVKEADGSEEVGGGNAFLSDEEFLAQELPQEQERVVEFDEDGATAEPVEETANTEPQVDEDYDIEQLKALHSIMTQPIKAGGRDITIKDPEHLRRLVQMGVGYNDKMVKLKADRVTATTLKDNGIDDDNKLNYLIELHKGNPQAIGRLLKEHKIDPFSVDLGEEELSAYKPNNHITGDKDIQFRSALEEVDALPGGSGLIDDITASWDNRSVDFVYNDPSLLYTLQSQKQSGLFDTVVDRIQELQLIGQLPDVSFIEKYHLVLTSIQEQSTVAAPETVNTRVAPIAQGTRKASGTINSSLPASNAVSQPNVSASSSGRTRSDVNYFNMSDSEIAKM